MPLSLTVPLASKVLSRRVPIMIATEAEEEKIVFNMLLNCKFQGVISMLKNDNQRIFKQDYTKHSWSTANETRD